jgi:hypothetical protein
MLSDDAVHQCKAYARALVFCHFVQALKDSEQFIRELHVKSCTVIFHKEGSAAVDMRGAYLYSGFFPVSGILSRHWR